jgi:hypothetical protein
VQRDTHVDSPLLRLLPGFVMHFAKHFSRTVVKNSCGSRGRGVESRQRREIDEPRGKETAIVGR